jgi:organic radical activating enzyme
VSVFKIQWNIGNECNFDCAYCPPSLKEGLTPKPDIKSFDLALENIAEQTAQYDLVEIELTGGEPTLYDCVRQRLSRDTGKLKFSFHSNSTADIDWWEKSANNLSEITLSLHQQVDFEHFVKVLSVLKGKCRLKVLVAMPVETFELQQFKYSALKDQYDVKPQMLYNNFTKGNNEYQNYTDTQWTWYFSETGINPKSSFDISNTIEFKRINKTNEYLGHLCWAGHSQIIIDPYGWAFRGWCKANTALGNVYNGSLILDRKPRVCPKQLCTNGFDLQAKKSEDSWGFT